MKIVVCNCVFIFLIMPVCMGQESNYYIPMSYESSLSTQFQNPSLISVNQDWWVQTAFQGRTGSFSNIYDAWLKGALAVNEKGEKHKSIVSLTFLNEKENGFISKTRFHFGLVRKQQLTKDVTLGLGVSLGLYNFFLKSSDVVEGASSWAVDGNAGVNLEYKNTQLGFGLCQMFNTAFVLISTQNRLSRYGQINLSQQLKFSPDVSGKIGGYYYPWRSVVSYQGFFGLDYQKKFFLETDYLDENGLTLTLGIASSYMQQTNFRLDFSSILLADKKLRSSAARYQLVLTIQ